MTTVDPSLSVTENLASTASSKKKRILARTHATLAVPSHFGTLVMRASLPAAAAAVPVRNSGSSFATYNNGKIIHHHHYQSHDSIARTDTDTDTDTDGFVHPVGLAWPHRPTDPWVGWFVGGDRPTNLLHGQPTNHTRHAGTFLTELQTTPTTTPDACACALSVMTVGAGWVSEAIADRP